MLGRDGRAGISPRENGGAQRLRASRAIAIAASLALCGCEESEPVKPREMTTADWLDACSPFDSFDAVQMLQFRISDQTVELSEAVGDDKAAGALLARHPKTIQGTWILDESTRTVEIKFGFDADYIQIGYSRRRTRTIWIVKRERITEIVTYCRIGY
jgi:hypothetical protein